MYNFTQDWFCQNIPVWEKVLLPLQGNELHVVEIGSFEGRSTTWLLDNIITNKSSILICIDTFEGSVEHGDKNHTDVSLLGLEQRFRDNIKKTGKEDQVIIRKGKSDVELPKLYNNHYDIIYVDGSHQASDVLSDLVMSWKLLKEGGILICDDYLWPHNYEEKNKPKLAIDSFMSCYHGQYEVLENGYQMILKKIPVAL